MRDFIWFEYDMILEKVPPVNIIAVLGGRDEVLNPVCIATTSPCSSEEGKKRKGMVKSLLLEGAHGGCSSPAA